jgi:cell division protein FtsZ
VVVETVSIILSNQVSEELNLFVQIPDSQDLAKVQKAKKIKLGGEFTKGLGAGNDPERGRAATVLSESEIKEALAHTEMLFIVAGMGGGTGTGGAPVVAKIAKDLGILTVAVVTTPFKYEQEKRAEQAAAGIAKLMQSVDSLIEIDNEKIFEIFPENAQFNEGFNAVNEVIANAVRGVSNVILNPATMNVDFADVQAAMSQKGMAIMCIGKASGPNRAAAAVDDALGNPFFNRAEVKNAKGLLVNICGPSGMEMQEINEIMTHAQKISQQGVEAIPGLTIDESFGDEISVTIIATGLRKFNQKLIDEFSTSYIRPVRDLPPSNTKENQGFIDPDKLKRIDILEVIRSIEN